jgi:phosphatidylglycerol:prolipoprotein diacylglycerol transferase
MPIGFNIGPLTIHYYGIIIMVGVLVATWVASWQARRHGQDPEIAWDVLPWLLIGGIIGARLWHVFTPSPTDIAEGRTTIFYLTHPLDLIAIWNGGLGILGAVIGGLIAFFIYARDHKLNIPMWLDFIAPGLLLAQAIGRWGNFVNQELYGAPTNLPWAIFIDAQHRLPGFADQAYYHPLFLYECLWNILNAGIILWIGRRYANRLKTGDLFLTYLILYPVARFILEFLRLNSSMIAGLNVNQDLYAVIAVVSAAYLIYRHRRPVQIQQPQLAEQLQDGYLPVQAEQPEQSQPTEMPRQPEQPEQSQQAGQSDLPAQAEQPEPAE